MYLPKKKKKIIIIEFSGNSHHIISLDIHQFTTFSFVSYLLSYKCLICLRPNGWIVIEERKLLSLQH